ncbi:hypothetical protein [Streptomyces sp. NPDC101165]|uniref:hypothetical protein n=1 Tax=Streptomyces sp. NPDC101165 TaxID=3366119 RepID=UPI0038308904
MERIDLTSASWTDRARSIQATSLREWVEESENYSHAQIYLPITSFPNGLLLDFSVRVAEGPAYLLPRLAQVELRVEYMKLLARRAGVEIEDKIRAFMQAAFGFTTAPWHEIRLPEFEKVPPTDRELIDLFHAYLKITMAAPWINSLPVRVVKEWIELARPIKDVAYQRSSPSIDSACAHPLLALPFVDNVSFDDPADVSQLLTELHDFLHLTNKRQNYPLVKKKEQEAAKHLLDRYAVYGNYWDAFVECVVPLDEPFVINISERRGLHFGTPGEATPSYGTSSGWELAKSSNQLVVFKDAGSNHVNVRVTDTNVELIGSAFNLSDDRGHKVRQLPDFFQSTSELLMFSSTKEDRPEHLWVNIPLKAASTTAVSRWTTVVMTSSALIGFIFLLFHWLSAGGNKTVNAGDVVVILVPTAIAASLLLVRESSTLSAQIAKEWSRTAAIFLLLLWLFTLFMFGMNKVDWGTKPERSTRSAENLEVRTLAS